MSRRVIERLEALREKTPPLGRLDLDRLIEDLRRIEKARRAAWGEWGRSGRAAGVRRRRWRRTGCAWTAG